MPFFVRERANAADGILPCPAATMKRDQNGPHEVFRSRQMDVCQTLARMSESRHKVRPSSDSRELDLTLHLLR